MALHHKRMPLSNSSILDSREVEGIAEYRSQLHAWLDAHADELEPRYAPPATLDDQIAQMQRVKSILFEAGWMRFGWPERVGGWGGAPVLRTELGAAISERDLVKPGLCSLVEVLAQALGVARSSLAVVAGETSRDKTLVVSGLEAATIRARLAAGSA